MARAHKIYFTWKKYNNKKENQQEWQLQCKILNETNSLPLLLLQSILRWEVQIKTTKTRKSWTSPHKASSEKNYDITLVFSDFAKQWINIKNHWSETSGDSGLSYHINIL